MTDYPYFVDVRDDSLNQDVGFTAAVPQVTMAWSSPIEVDEELNAERTVTTLMRSSAASWRSTSTDITPSLDLSREVVYTPEGEQKANTLAVMVEGRFQSFFDTSPLAEDESEPSALEEDGAEAEDAEEAEDVDTLGTVTTLIDKSPESARLIVIGSASFVADQTVRMIGSADGMIYVNSNQLMANLVDWGRRRPVAARNPRPRSLQSNSRTDGNGSAAGMGVHQLRAGARGPRCWCSASVASTG